MQDVNFEAAPRALVSPHSAWSPDGAAWAAGAIAAGAQGFCDPIAYYRIDWSRTLGSLIACWVNGGRLPRLGAA